MTALHRAADTPLWRRCCGHRASTWAQRQMCVALAGPDNDPAIINSHARCVLCSLRVIGAVSPTASQRVITRHIFPRDTVLPRVDSAAHRRRMGGQRCTAPPQTGTCAWWTSCCGSPARMRAQGTMCVGTRGFRVNQRVVHSQSRKVGAEWGDCAASGSVPRAPTRRRSASACTGGGPKLKGQCAWAAARALARCFGRAHLHRSVCARGFPARALGMCTVT